MSLVVTDAGLALLLAAISLFGYAIVRRVARRRQGGGGAGHAAAGFTRNTGPRPRSRADGGMQRARVTGIGP